MVVEMSVFSRTSAIERAFVLARSGRVQSVSELIQMVRLEGYDRAALDGPALRGQLKAALTGTAPPAATGPKQRRSMEAHKRWRRHNSRARAIAELFEL